MHNSFPLLWGGKQQVAETYTEFKPLQAVVYIFKFIVSKTLKTEENC